MPSHCTCDCACDTIIKKKYYKIEDLELTEEEYEKVKKAVEELKLAEKRKYKKEKLAKEKKEKRRRDKLNKIKIKELENSIKKSQEEIIKLKGDL